MTNSTDMIDRGMPVFFVRGLRVVCVLTGETERDVGVGFGGGTLRRFTVVGRTLLWTGPRRIMMLGKKTGWNVVWNW